MSTKWNLEKIIQTLDLLDPKTKPLWGEMSAQRMVEHLTDAVQIATGKNPQSLIIPSDKIESMQRFLESDKPMMRNSEVPFARKNVPLRNEEISLAIDEFVDEFILFETLFEEDENRKVMHPFYGELNYDQWKKMNDKHLSHHFRQFGLIPE